MIVNYETMVIHWQEQRQTLLNAEQRKGTEFTN